MFTTVLNLATCHEQTFSCSPREAVIAAYAQSRGDFNTWDYEKNYGTQVLGIMQPTHTTWNLGDFSAIERD